MNNQYPLVSIGIPTYNRGGSTLAQTIASACAQDYPHLEIIISDNCSPDHTQDVVGSFKDSRIKYIRQPRNVGPNNNYNACLNAATGTYFLLLHDDDLIDPDFVSTCMQATSDVSTDVGCIRTGARLIGKEGEHLKNEPNLVYSNVPDEMFMAWVSWKTSFYLCSTLFNTRALKEIGGFKSKNNLFEDGFAIIKLSANYPIINIVDIKASFRSHENQRTHAAAALNWSEDFRIALDMIYLQNPAGRKELYQKGMKLFTQVSIRFARTVKNPIKRMITVIKVGKFFPYYYWPNSADVSLKSRTARTIARLLYRNKRCLAM